MNTNTPEPGGDGKTDTYVVLDFETANEQRASPCAVGLVHVKDNKIADSWETLIDPETHFSPMNVMIHGITRDDVTGAPKFPDVIDRILAATRDAELVVAHNASFDVQVLAKTAARYQLELEPLSFACTRVFARRWWPRWPAYGLVPVIRQLGLADTLGEWAHHSALWDARACAQIATRGFAHQGVSTWAEAAEAAEIRLGVIDPASYEGCVARHGGSSAPIRPSRPDETELDTQHPLYGMNVCFTGALELYVRRDAAQAVADVGGYFSSNVTQKTDLLVVGTQDLNRIGEDGMSSKMRKAVRMAAEGHHIEIIDESDFYQMLSAPVETT